MKRLTAIGLGQTVDNHGQGIRLVRIVRVMVFQNTNQNAKENHEADDDGFFNYWVGCFVSRGPT